MIFESFREGSLDRAEQKAFTKLADTLIFETPQNFKLTRKSIPELSQKIQDQFLAQDERNEKGKRKWADDAIESVISIIKEGAARRAGGVPQPEAKKEAATPRREEEKKVRTPTEAFISTVRIYTSSIRYDPSNGYGAWGFTPKLAAARTKKDLSFNFSIDGKNCLGVTQALGGMYRRMGLRFEMGITANHPFAMVEFEDKTYLTSLYGIEEAKGKFETRDGYKMYIPAPADDIHQSLMLMWNFDEALVYEMLENIEVLRQISLGKEIEHLPGTLERAKEIANQHKDVLQAADWREIQRKIVPRLTGYFEDSDKSWAMEMDRVAVEQYMLHLRELVLEGGKRATSMKDMPLQSFIDEFLPIAKAHGEVIAAMVTSEREAPEGTPADVVNFTMQAREVLKVIEPAELKDEITRRFLVPFVSKSRTLTEE